MSALGSEAEIATHAVLRAQTIQQCRVIAVSVLEVCAQAKETCLPEDLRIRGVVPVCIEKQIARFAAKDSVYSQKVSIPVAVVIKRPEDDRYANLTPGR